MRRYSSAAVSMWYWLPATRTMAITRATTDWTAAGGNKVLVTREGGGSSSKSTGRSSSTRCD